MDFMELKAWLSSDDPVAELEQRRADGSLARDLPELDKLWGIPQPLEHHPEGDTGVHTLLVLRAVSLLTKNPRTRFAALTHDLGKGSTAPEEWPRHHGHEAAGQPLVNAIADRLGLPEDWRKLAILVATWHLNAHRVLELRPLTLISFFEKEGFYEEPDLLNGFLAACQADAQGRLGFEDSDYPQAAYVKEAYECTRYVYDARPEILQMKRIKELKRTRKLFLNREATQKDDSEREQRIREALQQGAVTDAYEWARGITDSGLHREMFALIHEYEGI